MRVEERDFELELPEGWSAVERDDGFEWVGPDGDQIIVSVLGAPASAEPVEARDTIVELRRKAHRTLSPTCVLEEVVRADSADELVASFGGVVPEHGLEVFVAVVATGRPVGGGHVLLTFAFTGVAGRGGAGRALFATLRFVPYAEALRRAEQRADQPLDRTRIFPYLAPEAYLAGAEPVQHPLRALGHGLAVFLAEDCDGVCRVLGREGIEKEGLGAEEGLALAVANLEGALARQEIPIERHQADDASLVRFGDHWLAASCLVVPGVADLARRTLGSDEIYASVPHRDVLLCFAAKELRGVERVCAAIRENEAEGRKPLTWELFHFGPRGPEPAGARGGFWGRLFGRSGN